jgi:hypothetical protein
MKYLLGFLLLTGVFSNTLIAQKKLSILVLDSQFARPMGDVLFIVNSVYYQTNDEGRCIVTIIKDSAKIELKNNGPYLEISLKITKDTSIVLTIPEIIAFTPVHINIEKSTDLIRSNSFVLNETVLKNAVLPAGTFDPIHLLLKLPGISNAQEMNSGLNIRGGGAYSTSVYWNDIPIPNISHSFGLISLFDINAIRKIEYFTSNVSAFYGNRGTSYIKFIGKETSLKKSNASVSLSPFLVAVNSNLPIVENKLGVNFTFRNSLFAGIYNNVFIPLFTNFSDISFQARFLPNRNNSISATVIENRDARKPGEFYRNQEFNDSNAYIFRSVSLRHEGLLGRKLSVTNILYFTNFENQFFKTNFNFLSITNRNKEFNFKSVFSKDLTRVQYKLGLEVMHIENNNRVFVNSDSIPNKTSIFANAFFADYSFQWNHLKLYINQRILKDWNQNIHVPMYEYRTGMEYQFNSKLKGFIGANKFVNNKQTISDGLIGKSNDFSFYADFKKILPQITIEKLLGIQTNWEKAHIGITYYRRNIQNLYDFISLYTNNYYYYSNLSKGSATSSGIETATQLKLGGRSTLNINYTYSNTLNINANVNNGKAYSANFDRPHNGNVSYTLTFGHILLNFSFVLESGRPITVPLFNAFLNTPGITIYSERNAVRLPLYHRLDMGIQLNQKKCKKLERSLGFHIYNVYAQKNIYGVIFIRDMTTNRYNYKYLVAFPFLPSVNYRISF